MDLAEIEREVLDGAASIDPVMAAADKPVRFVRFAMSHTGDTLDKALAIEVMLKRLGYSPAASTIDTSDYAFETAYCTFPRKSDAEAIWQVFDVYSLFGRGDRLLRDVEPAGPWL